MSQLIKKFIGNDQVDGAKIRLDNNQALRARNAANSADLTLVSLNASNQIVFGAQKSLFSASTVMFSAASNPGSPVAGELYYNSGSNELRFYNGSSFLALSSGSGANTALSNLASVAINSDLLPGVDNTINLGSAALTYAIGYIQILRDPTDNPVLSVNTRELMDSSGSSIVDFSSTSQVLFYKDIVFNQPGNVQTIDTGLANTASMEVKSGNASTGFDSGQAFFRSGNGDNSADAYFGSGVASVGNSGAAHVISNLAEVNSGDVLISSGAATTGDSGDINLTIGSAAGTRGKIVFVDGSEGTAGYVWTSTDTAGSGAWAATAATVTNNKETIVLSGTDITNQYVDLAHVAKTNSINMQVKGGAAIIEGASYDYSVSYTGGAGGNTRVTFLNDLATGGASALIAADVLQFQYEY